MGDESKIEWTDATWNPIRGCTRVSEGCRNCYAEAISARFSGPGEPYDGIATRVTRPDGRSEPRWTGKIALVEKALTQPLRWKKPRRIFVNSMSDLFHEDLPDETIDKVFAVMALAPQHTFQVLTKRHERMRRYMRSRFSGEFNTYVSDAGMELTHSLSEDDMQEAADWTDFGKPLPNVWLGVSVEDQATADARVPELLMTPAAVRFVSAEPLLGPVDFTKHLLNPFGLTETPRWIIAGGESGPGARPMHPDWPRSIRDQCKAAGVPFFFKQWGEWAPFISSGGLPLESGTFAAVKVVDSTDRSSIGRISWQAGHGPERPSTLLGRVGKNAAGRLLDEVAHDAFPEATR